jgi:hypothetical protein
VKNFNAFALVLAQKQKTLNEKNAFFAFVKIKTNNYNFKKRRLRWQSIILFKNPIQ